MKYILDKYYKKTKGYYPFFKYCPKMYWDYYLKRRAFDVLGYDYNPQNPKTFNEKIRWLIYNEKLELKTKLTDKILVKSFIAKKLGPHHCAELYGIYNNIDEIDFDLLPEQFVLKANHGWRMNIIVKDKRFIYNNFNKIKRITAKWLHTNYELYSLEPQYRKIKRHLLVEQYRRSNNINSYRQDISVHCFNGQPLFIELLIKNENSIHFQFYNTDWKLQNFTHSFEFLDIIQKPPQKLDEILNYAKILSSDFLYVRVDFDFDNNDIHLVEMTFTPCSALIPFHNKQTDLMLGEMLHINKEQCA